MKALIALASIVGFLMVVLPGPLYQFADVNLSTAFTSLRFGVYVGGASLILIVLHLLINRKDIKWGSTLVCALLSLVAVAMPVSMMSKASGVPPIHDITTDVTNPPEFVAIAPLREQSPNPITYEGGEVTKQQLTAYPEIKTQQFPQPIQDIFSAAEKTVDSLGWKRLSEGALPNTLEATDTTFWFGFKDDIVVRLTSENNVTMVDVRSKSRVGKSDLGKNAERINLFFSTLREQLAN
ncbi:DUF1499 domain-containing protein [Aestuariibacter sp. A3R04]|uniref:DUF1499 domain-containing protein n=1 Tax=Aestuariibacter sp. A3R04 TaxID=2841571 RepID=UPI001C097207|nr:DUF1499 domain-containing protein [Aestuariibacter sp. A3R04]MBU3023875.1 DUF1499 domain-containing protein [Aestuariibacter sp. A3R04]